MPGATRQARVLLFDNHPDTLRLLFHQELARGIGVTSPEPRRALHVLLAMSLICILIVAIVWPLIAQ
jgi:hypothetical protein